MKDKAMNNDTQRYEFFEVSVDRTENRAFVEDVSQAIVQAIKPDQAAITPYLFDAIMDRAARGEVLRAGSDTAFGIGGADLLLYVVVPIVSNLVTSVCIAAGVAGVRGLFTRPPTPPQISHEELQRYLRASDVHLGRRELDRCVDTLNSMIVQRVSALRVIPLSSGQSPERNDRIDYVLLRQLIHDAFNRNELQVLCFDLREYFDDIGVDDHMLTSVRLIEHFARRGRLSELMAALAIARPHVDWGSVSML